MKPKIKLAFLSGTDELNRRLIERMRALYPELPLWVVSDFPPEDRELKWIRYRVNRSLAENLRNAREELKGESVRLAAVMLVPNVPFRRMRLLAFLISPRGFLAFNENLNNFMLRPSSLPTIARHIAWRVKNTLRWTLRAARKTDWRLSAGTRGAVRGRNAPQRTARAVAGPPSAGDYGDPRATARTAPAATRTRRSGGAGHRRTTVAPTYTARLAPLSRD